MNNEPVAIRYNYDGNGYQYKDEGDGSNWMERIVEGEFLYTHPANELQPYPTAKQYADALAEIEYWKSAFERAMEVKK
jgi:hypothetical protein